MKWLALSISIMGISCFAQTTYVPDNNFEQVLIDLGHDDHLDNYVETANIQSITQLFLFEKGISDLTGIEDFTSLTYLDCENNLLSSLNLSQNTALTFLNCGMNQLSSLDLTQNLALENLSFHENRITEIDLSQNINLTHITAQQTNLQSLDLSSNAELIYLILWENNLNSLNIKNGNNLNLELVQTWGNPNLNCIQVDDEQWAENTLRNYGMCNFDAWTSFSEDCASMNVSENEIRTLSVYPNPVKDRIHFSEKLNQVEIFSVNGKKIIQSKDAESLNVNHLPNGTYFLKGENVEGRIVQTTFVKK